MSKKILKYKEFITESFGGGGPSEFNLSRFNSDTFNPAVQVDDSELSQDAFDKHQNNIRLGVARLNDIMKNISNVSNLKNIKSYFTLSDQNVKSMKILRISKSNGIKYDVFVAFVIKETEYYGCIKNILDANPEFNSEIFRDNAILQTKEWKIKIKGVIINSVKKWLHIENGMYKALRNEIYAINNDNGRMLELQVGDAVEVLRSHENKIYIKFLENYYTMSGDNFVYFNWWFEKIVDEIVV